MAFSFIVVSEEFNSNVTAFLILPLANAFVTGSSCSASFEERKATKCFSFFFTTVCTGFFSLCLLFNGERGTARTNSSFLVEGEWNNDLVDGLTVLGGLCILVREPEKRDFYSTLLVSLGGWG